MPLGTLRNRFDRISSSLRRRKPRSGSLNKEIEQDTIPADDAERLDEPGTFDHFSLITQAGHLKLDVPGSHNLKCIVDRKGVVFTPKTEIALLVMRDVTCDMATALSLLEFSENYNDSEQFIFHNFNVFSLADYVAAIEQSRMRLKVIEYKLYIHTAANRILLMLYCRDMKVPLTEFNEIFERCGDIRNSLNYARSKVATRISLLENYHRLWLEGGEKFYFLEEDPISRCDYDSMVFARLKRAGNINAGISAQRKETHLLHYSFSN